MRTLSLLVLSVCLACGGAQADMFGDVMVPDALNPEVQSATGHNNRTAVALHPPEGKAFVIYAPSAGRDHRPWTPLQFIAHELAGKGEVVIFNLGGRPWFGVRETMPGNVAFFDGYTHRNGVVYNIAFSLDDMAFPDAEVKLSLARIRVLPNLNGSPAMTDAALAADYFEAGEWDEASEALVRASELDTANWYVYYLLGRLSEGEGELETAAQYYEAAANLNPGDTEPPIRRASAMTLAGGDGGQGSSDLLALAAANTEEPAVWEELGRVYLAAGETETARGYFEEAAAVNPASELALYNLSFIHSEAKDYENALRRAREFMYYFSWMPTGVVPDVTGAPGMTEARIREIMAEPLPLGRIGRGGEVAAQQLTSDQIEIYYELITVPQTQIIYEAPTTVYAPVIVYDWGWSPRWYRPWRPDSGGSWFHRPRPPIHRPGGPAIRPPRPPNRPNRPGGISRPPSPGGRPPAPGQRPPPPGSGSRPPGGSRPPPGNGSRPPTPPGSGSRPPGPGSRPPGGVQPAPMPTPPVIGTPGRPRPPERPGSSGSSGITTLPAPIPSRPDRTRPAPGSERPARPDVVRPGTRPTPPATSGPSGQPERPRPSAPEARPTPSRPGRPETRPAPSQPSRPETRPAPSQPSRPAPSQPSRPETRPAPSRPSRPEARPAPRERPAPKTPQPNAEEQAPRRGRR